MTKTYFPQRKLSLQQRILAETRRKQTALPQAASGGYRIFRKIINAPSVEESLTELQRRGVLSQSVPPFALLDEVTIAHTFRVCEATQHFVQGDFGWFYTQLAVQDVAQAEYLGAFTTIHDVFQKLSLDRQKLMFYLALFHDIGKAIDTSPFHFHPELSAILAQQVFSQWGFSEARINFAVPVIQKHTLIGSLISGQACPTTVLWALNNLTPRTSLQEAYFAAILALNVLDVSGWGTRGFQYSLLSRHRAVADLSKYPRLERDFYRRRLQVLSRSYEESVIHGEKRGTAFDVVLDWIDKLVTTQEVPHFVEGINKGIIFYGLDRVLSYLSPKNKVKLLRTLAQLRTLFLRQNPELSGSPFYVVSKDALGRLSKKDLDFERKVNGTFDSLPEVFSAEDLGEYLETNGFETLFGIPLQYDRDAVYMDFASMKV